MFETKMSREKLQMEEKSCALTLFEKGESVIAVAGDIGVSRKAIYQLKRSAAPLSRWYQNESLALAHQKRLLQEQISF